MRVSQCAGASSRDWGASQRPALRLTALHPSSRRLRAATVAGAVRDGGEGVPGHLQGALVWPGLGDGRTQPRRGARRCIAVRCRRATSSAHARRACSGAMLRARARQAQHRQPAVAFSEATGTGGGSGQRRSAVSGALSLKHPDQASSWPLNAHKRLHALSIHTHRCSRCTTAC